MNEDEIKVNEELVLRLASAAFELHPNTGTWATAYHRRVAAILEGFEDERVRVTPRLQALADVLADTGVDPVLALDAWRVATGEELGLESEIYAYMEAWREEEREIR